MSFLSKLTDLPEGHPETYEDFNKRYLHTYFQYKKDNNESIIVNYIGNTGKALIFENPTGERHTIFDTENPNIEPFLPKVGYYNLTGSCLYLYKNPTKQYKRSFCNTTYSVSLAETQRIANWGNLATSILHSKYVPLDAITHRHFSNVALSPFFALLNDGKKCNLYYRLCIVGTIDIEKQEVLFEQPTLLQEIQDLFKNSGVLKWKIRVM